MGSSVLVPFVTSFSDSKTGHKREGIGLVLGILPQLEVEFLLGRDSPAGQMDRTVAVWAKELEKQVVTIFQKFQLRLRSEYTNNSNTMLCISFIPQTQIAVLQRRLPGRQHN